jgi:hypothetical protein
MRFMMLYKSGRETHSLPAPQEMAAVGGAGVVIATDGPLPRSRGECVRISGNEFLVTDGPFAETKELVGG